MKKILILLLLIVAPVSLAWDHAGHKLISHIAYHHLSLKAKVMVDRLTTEANHDYPPEARFLYISTWADWERAKGNNQFTTWHYIDLPYADVGFLAKPPETQNVVYGINHCVTILKQPARSSTEQQIALKLLVHLVGDIHQPLHNISRYNFKHPAGDRGGNSYQIHSKTASNLHSYWDLGLGEFRRFQASTPETAIALKKYAESIEQRYPETAFVPARLTTKPMEWAQEGYDLARMFVYQINEHATPSRQYHYDGKQIMEQRIAIAAYRLAAMLNQIYA